MLVAMKGHPACGKSSLARSLGKALAWPVLDKDDILDCTFSLQNLHHVPHPLLNSFSYEVLWRLVGTQLQMGLSVIVDCPLARPSLFLLAKSLASRHSARLVIIECIASDFDEWKRRFEGRAAADALCMDEDQGQGQETLGTMQDAQENGSVPADSGNGSPRLVEFTALPQEPGLSSRNQETVLIHDSQGSKVSEGVPFKGWHKPGTWEGLQKLIQAYENSWEYDTSASCKKLVVDTTALHHDALLSGTLTWIRAVSDETPAVTFLAA